MEKILTTLVFEIMGKPENHVNETLRTLITKIGSEKGVNMTGKTYHDAAPVEKSKGLFTAFAEVEIEFDKLEDYFGIIFAYMPSHVEIIKPENLDLTNAHLTDLANQIVQRLHNYDAVTKNTLMEAELLKRKLQEVAPHLFEKKKSQPEEKPSEAKEKTSEKESLKEESKKD